MLSFGMEYDRAFSIAFCSARFADGSPPPSFAATMIARVSFEKSLPRFASAAPFLCLIVDHLLCPDTRRLPYLVQKELVDPRIVGQLGMERRNEDPSLPREHRMPVDLGEHLDVGPRLLDPRRADEDGAHGLVPVPDIEVGLEAVHLPAEGIAADGDVCETEVVAVEHNHPGARAEDRRLERAQRVVEVVQLHHARHRGRLAAGDDQAVEAVELLRQAHLDRIRAETAQHPRVLAEVPLHGKDADPKRLRHELKGNYSAGSGRREPQRPSTTKTKPSPAATTIGTQPFVGSPNRPPLAQSIEKCTAAASMPSEPITVQLERATTTPIAMKSTLERTTSHQSAVDECHQ